MLEVTVSLLCFVAGSHSLCQLTAIQLIHFMLVLECIFEICRCSGALSDFAGFAGLWYIFLLESIN